MLILASICTAYAFTASVKVMKNCPYTVMLTTNLEPWNYFGVLLLVERKNEFLLLCRSRNYHHYSNFKWDYQTQGR
jgi:hypothetical protein